MDVLDWARSVDWAARGSVLLPRSFHGNAVNSHSSHAHVCLSRAKPASRTGLGRIVAEVDRIASSSDLSDEGLGCDYLNVARWTHRLPGLELIASASFVRAANSEPVIKLGGSATRSLHIRSWSEICCAFRYASAYIN